ELSCHRGTAIMAKYSVSMAYETGHELAPRAGHDVRARADRSGRADGGIAPWPAGVRVRAAAGAAVRAAEGASSGSWCVAGGAGADVPGSGDDAGVDGLRVLTRAVVGTAGGDGAGA